MILDAAWAKTKGAILYGLSRGFEPALRQNRMARLLFPCPDPALATAPFIFSPPLTLEAAPAGRRLPIFLPGSQQIPDLGQQLLVRRQGRGLGLRRRLLGFAAAKQVHRLDQ